MCQCQENLINILLPIEYCLKEMSFIFTFREYVEIIDLTSDSPGTESESDDDNLPPAILGGSESENQ